MTHPSHEKPIDMATLRSATGRLASLARETAAVAKKNAGLRKSQEDALVESGRRLRAAMDEIRLSSSHPESAR